MHNHNHSHHHEDVKNIKVAFSLNLISFFFPMTAEISANPHFAQQKSALPFRSGRAGFDNHDCLLEGHYLERV